MTSQLLTGPRYELQLFDLEEDYCTINRFDSQVDAEAAIGTIPDSLLRDYFGIRIIDWQTESEVVEYLIASNCKVLWLPVLLFWPSWLLSPMVRFFLF